MTGVFRYAARFITARVERRLAAALLVTLTLISLLFLAVFVGVYEKQLIAEHARAASQLNQLLQASLENSMLKRDLPGLRKVVGELGRQEDVESVQIVNPNREVRFASDPTAVGTKFAASEYWPAASEAPLIQSTVLKEDSDGGHVLRSINPVSNRGECRQCHGSASENPVNGVLVIDYRADMVPRRARAGAIAMTGSGLIVAIAVLLATWFAIRRYVLTPLQGVEHTSQLLADGDFSARVMPSGTDEMAVLGRRFDTMADRLSGTIESLQSSERFLQAVIDAVPDGVRVISEDFRILKANRAYCEQIGAANNKVVGQYCYESSHARDSPCPLTLVTCPVAEIAEGGETHLKCRHKHVDSDGNPLFVEVSAARAELMIEGRVQSCVIESIRDLSQQTEFSHQERLAGLAVLAAGVAHEIHNPLSSISLALQALETEIVNSQAATSSSEYLGAANREIQNCLTITERLLRMSEPTSDHPVLVSMERIVDDVISLLAYQVRQNAIAVETDFASPPRVLAAESDMRILVLNLIQNAFHAMPDGGTLKIAGRREDGDVVLEFSDTGIGIAPENVEKIFWPFWSDRGDASHGSGLGLPICRSIAERWGGKITVAEKPGYSTSFVVRIPDADSEGSE